MSAVTLKLTCLIWPDNIAEHLFRVKVEDAEDVLDLKNLIKFACVRRLAGINVTDLVLWRCTNLPNDDDSLQEALNTIQFDGSDTRLLRLGKARQCLGEYFGGEDLSVEPIHILVQVPDCEPPSAGRLGTLMLSLDTPDQFLKSRYGFTMSPHASAPNPSDRVQSAQKAYDILGNKRFDTLGSSWSSSCIEWANVSYNNKPPSNLPMAWDISPMAANGLSLQSDTLQLWQLTGGYLIGIKKAPESQDWLFFVKEAMTVAQIYRHKTSMRGIARILISRGIAFNTVRYRDLQRRPVPQVIDGFGYRRAGYQPSANDYASYVERRDRLLKGPAGQAALKMGGIVWRLAIDLVPVKEVLDGPARNADWNGQVLGEDEGKHVVDDCLDRTALNLICGVYRVETSPGANQHSESSWWPQHHSWITSGMCHGHWTVDNEAWFQRWLGDIQQGKAKLRGITDWRRALQYHYRVLPVITSNIEAHCKAWVSKEIASGQHRL